MKKLSLKQAPKKAMIRCSSLPLFFDCPAAILNPDKLTSVRVVNGFENLGTDIHLAIQHCIESGEMDLRKIERYYAAEDVERAKILFLNGLAVVEEAKRDMVNPQFEVEVFFETEKYSVTGHVDVLDCRPDCAYVVDFKTGRTRDNHYHQMVGYAVGAWTKVGRPDKYEVNVAYVYLENKEPTHFRLTADDLKAWIKELDALPVQYNVNRRCIYCPLNNTCPAFRDYVKGSLSFLLETQKVPASIRKMDGTALSRLAVALKMAATACDRIRAVIKEEALKGGDIPIGNGDKYTIAVQKHRVVLAGKALPVLAKYLSAKDIAKATRLSLPDLIAAAGARVKGPMKKIIREELNNKLEKAGAIVTSEQPQLRTFYAGGSKWPKRQKK